MYSVKDSGKLLHSTRSHLASFDDLEGWGGGGEGGGDRYEIMADLSYCTSETL